MPVIRRGSAADLDRVELIQSQTSTAAHWPPREYLDYYFDVAELNGQVAGFVVWRALAEPEYEILNLAVASDVRRTGVARALLEPILQVAERQVFLEVRASNRAARMFYKSMGFKEVTVRRKYYENPPESGIVMLFHSC